ncbi:MAG: hypothetical protein WCT20_01750 [Candidatus Babeliales bacterium]|jgi:phospholipase A2
MLNKFKKLMLFTLTLVFSSSYSTSIPDSKNQISVINHTDQPIWVGAYRLRENLVGSSVGRATLQGDIVEIQKNGMAQLDRPEFKIETNREIIFSDNKEVLKKKLTADEYRLANKTAIGYTNGSVFHIAQKDNVLYGYSNIGWTIIKPLMSSLQNMWSSDDKNATSDQSMPQQKATVRRDSHLAPGETAFLGKRLPLVKKTLEQLFNTQLAKNETPRIAICTSGGGIRAATATLGLLEGLNEIGLLNGLTYAAALSGSSWIVSNFIELGLPVDKYTQHFITAISAKNYCSATGIPYLFSNIRHVLRPKYVFDQSYNIVDICGVALAHTFFHNVTTYFGPDDLCLSGSQRYMVKGESFFPIYTAIQVAGDLMNTATFTPYEFGIDNLNMHIPIWAFGRKFKNGTSINFAPELSLGYLMGIWGSAFSGTFRTFFKKIHWESILNIFAEISVDEGQFAGISIFNPLYGVSNSFVRNLSKLTLMDHGYSTNLPLVPLLKKERKVDIIFVMDASGDVHDSAPELQEVIKIANSLGVHFDPIHFDEVASHQLSVIKGKEGTSAPTIIFVPPVKNEHFDPTFDPKKELRLSYPIFKFRYTPEEINKLSGLLRQNIIDNKDLIMNAIREKIEQKHKSLWGTQQISQGAAHA